MASLRHNVRVATRSLLAHRLRATLTTLGIVLGVASVIVMLAVGEAARYTALKQLEDLGANTIVLKSTKPAEETGKSKGGLLVAYGLTFADLERIRESLPTVALASPMRECRKRVRYRDRKSEARIVSITDRFLGQNNIHLAAGRGIDAQDEFKKANVAVIGHALAEMLFPTENPIGRSVQIENQGEMKLFTIVGICEPKTLATGSESPDAADFNKVLFIPFESDRARFGRDIYTFLSGVISLERLDMSQLVVAVDNVANVPRTAVAIQSLIDQYHPSKDVTMIVPLELLRKAEETQRLFTLILGAIAGISLLVGGIGIMNIMLATVTERTREIGVRRALGAKRRDIAMQFLVETVTLSCGGGIIGVAVGIGFTFALTELFTVPTLVKAWAPIVAFGVSVAVGVLSGVYPSWRAARLDPIEALRHN
jgi:putative ABC transport system permease protein